MLLEIIICVLGVGALALCGWTVWRAMTQVDTAIERCDHLIETASLILAMKSDPTVARQLALYRGQAARALADARDGTADTARRISKRQAESVATSKEAGKPPPFRDFRRTMRPPDEPPPIIGPIGHTTESST